MKRKKSKRQSGNEFQDKCANWLKDNGWTVHNQKTVTRQIRTKKGFIWISVRQDIFGCDLICLKPHRKPLFIQCTLHGSVQKRLDELKKYPFPLQFVEVQLWQGRPDAINIKRYDGEEDGKELVDWGKIIRGKLYLRGNNETNKQ